MISPTRAAFDQKDGRSDRPSSGGRAVARTARMGRCRLAHDALAKCDPHPAGHAGKATSGPDLALVTPAGRDRLFVETMARAHAADDACGDHPEHSTGCPDKHRAPIAPTAATGPGNNHAKLCLYAGRSASA